MSRLRIASARFALLPFAPRKSRFAFCKRSDMSLMENIICLSRFRLIPRLSAQYIVRGPASQARTTLRMVRASHKVPCAKSILAACTCRTL